jgi:hypothetical protein
MTSKRKITMVIPIVMKRKGFCSERLKKKLIQLDRLNVLKRSPKAVIILRELYAREGIASTRQLRLALFPDYDNCNTYTQEDLNVLFSKTLASIKKRTSKVGVEILYCRVSQNWYGIVPPRKQKPTPRTNWITVSGKNNKN